MNRLIQDDTAPPERRSERRWRIERDHYEPHCAALDGAWGAAERVDARAWSDLEMDLVFERFDRSATPCGSQWLRWRMSRYASADEAAQTASDIDTLARDKPLAERLKRALEGLNCKEAGRRVSRQTRYRTRGQDVRSHQNRREAVSRRRRG